MFWPRWFDKGFSPLKRGCAFVMRADKGINGLSQLSDGEETGAAQGMTAEQAEPDFDLIEPRGMSGCEVEVNIGMASKPSVLFGLVGIEIVQNNMNLFLGVVGDNVIHEVEELAAPAPRVMARLNQSRRHLEGSKESAGSMSHIFVTESREGPAIGQS